MTLEDLLQSRDARVAHQTELLREHPGKSLLCLTVMPPGPVKRSELSLRIAAAAVEAVRDAFSPVFEELRDLETGYEGYFIVDSDPLSAKKLAVTLEETHPLGRLFDLDVILSGELPVFPDGGGKLGASSLKKPVFADGSGELGASSLKKPVFADGVRPLGREELGLAPRKCIICGSPVRECMHERTHTTEELLDKYQSIICHSGLDPESLTTETNTKTMYKYKQSGNTYILSLDNHVEVTAALAAFCEEKGIRSGKIEGLGAVSEATFRYLDPKTMKYVDKTFTEQMEITSLVGNISRKDGKPYLHIHITASRSDYSCIGGHLLTAKINGACELFVTDLGVEVGRYLDEEIGLNLYSL